jgi:hypothetical protein
MLLLVITFTIFSVDANSCGMKKKKYNQCDKPVDHTNRKMSSCNKNNSCGQKNVRVNKFAKRKSCN